MSKDNTVGKTEQLIYRAFQHFSGTERYVNNAEELSQHFDRPQIELLRSTDWRQHDKLHDEGIPHMLKLKGLAGKALQLLNIQQQASTHNRKKKQVAEGIRTNGYGDEEAPSQEMPGEVVALHTENPEWAKYVDINDGYVPPEHETEQPAQTA